MGVPENLFAFTAPGASYPEYCSLNLVDGKIRLTIRSAPTSQLGPGREASIDLSADHARQLGQGCIAASERY